MLPHMDIGEIKALTRQHVETGSTKISCHFDISDISERHIYILCVSEGASINLINAERGVFVHFLWNCFVHGYTLCKISRIGVLNSN